MIYSLHRHTGGLLLGARRGSWGPKRQASHAVGDTIEDGAQWTAPVMFSYKFLYKLYKPHEDMITI